MDSSFSTSAFFLLFMSVSILVDVSHGSQFITWDDLSLNGRRDSNSDDGSEGIRVLTVRSDGRGDSRTVQGAVNLVPNGNTQRVRIFIAPGLYREKVTVPSNKPYISFIGYGKTRTRISYNLKASDRDGNGQVVGTFASATVAVESDFFCATGITFENTVSSTQAGAVGMQAVALRLSGDKAMLYDCNILGSQDTLYDHIGRHYFLNCFIQGSIDFIFGNAKSLYQGCTLQATASGYGAIAASQRNSESEDSGFSFVNCRLMGTGMIYLGRAWGRYARVVYSYCKLEGIVVPEGWSDWGDSSRRSTVYFGEFNCDGAGAESNERARWARSLNYEQARPFLDRLYISGNQWLRL